MIARGKTVFSWRTDVEFKVLPEGVKDGILLGGEIMDGPIPMVDLARQRGRDGEGLEGVNGQSGDAKGAAEGEDSTAPSQAIYSAESSF